MRALSFFLLAVATIAATAAQPGAGTVRDGTYHYAPIGWSMPVPEGWRVRESEEVTRRNAGAQARMEEALGGEIVRTDTQLLYLDRDARNAFTSAVQPPEPSMDYADEQQATLEALLTVYRRSGLRTRHEQHVETIDGIDFLRVDVVFLDADGRRLGLEQSIYDARVGNVGMTVSLTWDNASAHAELLRAWRASRFTPGATPD